MVENRYNEKDELFDEMVGMFGSARTDEGLFNAVLKLYDIKDKIELLKGKGFKSKEIAEIFSSLYNFNKNDIKQLLY